MQQIQKRRGSGDIWLIPWASLKIQSLLYAWLQTSLVGSVHETTFSPSCHTLTPRPLMLVHQYIQQFLKHTPPPEKYITLTMTIMPPPLLKILDPPLACV